MADINVDEIGPVRADHERTGSHEKLIDSNTIRVLDLVMIMKAEDGSVAASELRDADDSRECDQPDAMFTQAAMKGA